MSFVLLWLLTLVSFWLLTRFPFGCWVDFLLVADFNFWLLTMVLLWLLTPVFIWLVSLSSFACWLHPYFSADFEFHSVADFIFFSATCDFLSVADSSLRLVADPSLPLVADSSLPLVADSRLPLVADSSLPLSSDLVYLWLLTVPSFGYWLSFAAGIFLSWMLGLTWQRIRYGRVSAAWLETINVILPGIQNNYNICYLSNIVTKLYCQFHCQGNSYILRILLCRPTVSDKFIGTWSFIKCSVYNNFSTFLFHLP